MFSAQLVTHLASNAPGGTVKFVEDPTHLTGKMTKDREQSIIMTNDGTAKVKKRSRIKSSWTDRISVKQNGDRGERSKGAMLYII